MSIGHPTKKTKGARSLYCFISRGTISKEGFQLIIHDDKGQAEYPIVKLDYIIREQKEICGKYLKYIKNELLKEKQLHKRRYRVIKLKKLFSESDNFMQNIFNGVHSETEHRRGLLGVECANELIEEFKELLEKRGMAIDTYDPIKDIYRMIPLPLKQLELYFKETNNKELVIRNKEIAYIFYYFIKGQMTKLEEIAKSIDDEYEK